MAKRGRQGSYDVSRTDCISSRNGGSHVYRQSHSPASAAKPTLRGQGTRGVPNDDGTVHFSGDDDAGKDTSTDRDLTGERTLFVYPIRPPST